VHVKHVEDSNIEIFLAALKRFCARRGKSFHFCSGHAINFLKARIEINALQKFVASNKKKYHAVSKLANNIVN
jgi:hypothetical protein